MITGNRLKEWQLLRSRSEPFRTTRLLEREVLGEKEVLEVTGETKKPPPAKPAPDGGRVVALALK